MGREDLIVTDERVSKETKLHIAKELVASYVRSDASRDVRPEQLGDAGARLARADARSPV